MQVMIHEAAGQGVLTGIVIQQKCSLHMGQTVGQAGVILQQLEGEGYLKSAAEQGIKQQEEKQQERMRVGQGTSKPCHGIS
jgi:hypothetical protein